MKKKHFHNTRNVRYFYFIITETGTIGILESRGERVCKASSSLYFPARCHIKRSLFYLVFNLYIQFIQFFCKKGSLVKPPVHEMNARRRLV